MAEWAELQIPVGIAFFFVNSALGRVVASYPSPAGVTECELDLAAWDRLAETHPLLRAPQPDVEAILVRAARRRRPGPSRPSLSPSTSATRWPAPCGWSGTGSTAGRKSGSGSLTCSAASVSAPAGWRPRPPDRVRSR